MKIKKYIREFLYKSFQPFSRNSKIQILDYSGLLLKIAGRNTYVETLSNKADSLHRRIEISYEEEIRDTFLKIISKLVKYTRLTNVKLAIDITDEDFYGKTNNIWIHGWTGEKGVVGKFKYIVLSRVDKYKIPILALPFHVGMNKTDAIDFLLKIARKLFRSISVVLFDRGFYSGEIFALLENTKINYLMFVPENKAVKRYWKEGLDVIKHEVKYNLDKTWNKVKIKLVLVEYQENKWTFATNLKLRNALDYIFLYKKRWQIETNFRVMDEAMIKSRSVNYLVRYFYFMFALLLHVLWCLFGNVQFKRFIYDLENLFGFEILGIRYVFDI